MTPTAAEITLQINFSAGDLAYAEETAPVLVNAHRRDVGEVVAVIDCCPPPATPWTPPGRDDFARRLPLLRKLGERLLRQGVLDRIIYLEPDRERLRRLNQKYCGWAAGCSHDHLGHAFSAYFAGWEASRARYLLHLDADLLFHQEPDYRWPGAAVAALRQNERFLAASPRIAPPRPGFPGEMVDVRRPGSGWLPSWSLAPAAEGWSSDWFSTRCHLMDLERLRAILPLRSSSRGFGTESPAFAALFSNPFWRLTTSDGKTRPLFARALGKAIRRCLPPLPLPPEVLLHEHAAKTGMRCLYLNDPRAWFIHPDTKPPDFPARAAEMAAAVARGEVPPDQRGVSGIQWNAWRPNQPASHGSAA